MPRIPGTYIKLLIVVFLALRQPAGAADWPVKGNVDLSSGFGDYRLNRFHAGVDIRTGGEVGTKVYSPVKGYVWRIRMSYDGYGKGLYIKSATGNLYVFGHLDSFAPQIDSLVKSIQSESKRYYQDLYFPEDSIKIAAGDFIAVSGRTGTSGPHLHFEVRNPDNKPLNPLLHHYKLRDYEMPVFERIIFQMTDSRSLFDNGQRTLELPVVRGRNATIYHLDTVLYLNKPFGLLATSYDRSRGGGMAMTPYLMAVIFDDSLHYEVVMDTLDFDEQRSVNLEYDIVKVAYGDKRTRRLYHRAGNNYDGSRGHAPGNGIFGVANTETYGKHRGKLVAMDHLGHLTELHFNFVWGPEEYLYQLDSTKIQEGNQVSYFLSPGPHRYDFPFDSAVAMEEVDGRWMKSARSTVTFTEKRKIILQTEKVQADRTSLRLNVYSLDCEIPDIVIAQTSENTPSRISVQHEVVDDGLLVRIDTDASDLVKPAVELYSGDSLLGVEYADFCRGSYGAFIAPQSKYAHIDRIVCRLSGENAASQADIRTDIYLVGDTPDEIIKAGERYTLQLGNENFYEPRFIEIRTDINRPRFLQILPEAFVCRADFALSMNRPYKTNPPEREGVCWWDNKENEWVWLENESVSASGYSSPISGGGSFEILGDTRPPEISQLNITDGLTYFDPMQEINFVLYDSLSGFEDDRSILIELDGKWMIPEYNPNTKICKTSPLKPLSDGKHKLRIQATDRRGNKVERELHFFIKKQG